MVDGVVKEPTIDIEKMIADKLAIQQADFDKKLKDELEKQRQSFDKSLDNTLLEMVKPKTEEVIKEPEGKSDVMTLAERIEAKREAERLAREKLTEDNEKEKMRKELEKYKLKDQLDKIKREEPYLADIIDEGILEGTITSIEQINMVFNDKLKNKLKASYQFEKAITAAGGDPLSYLEENNIITDEIAKKKRYEELVAQKRAKYRR